MSLYLGLMSGTSADAVDAALVDFSGPEPELRASLATPIPAALKTAITSLYLPSSNEIDRLGALDSQLGHFFADCALHLLYQARVAPKEVYAIGSHGQTIRHRPRPQQSRPFSLQIADPNIIAEQTGITTIADFRRRDMACGGQGAPLAPGFHQAVFAKPGHHRAVLNIGGIANLTHLPANGSTTGFDTGPGNGLMDAWILHHQDLPYDRDGRWAASGKVNEPLLQRLLGHPFFGLPTPKSTGREEFSLSWLMSVASTEDIAVPADVQRTLLALTVTTIAEAVRHQCPSGTDIFLCGGGVHNSLLLNTLQQALPDHPLASTEALGVAPDWVEAMAFAWLAMRTLQGLSGNLPSVTNASRPAVLGGVYPGRLSAQSDLR